MSPTPTRESSSVYRIVGKMAGLPGSSPGISALLPRAPPLRRGPPPHPTSSLPASPLPSSSVPVYSLVARGTCVLAEFTTTSGNFTTVTRRILEKLPSEDSKMSYVRGRPWCLVLVATLVQHLRAAQHRCTTRTSSTTRSAAALCFSAWCARRAHRPLLPRPSSGLAL